MREIELSESVGRALWLRKGRTHKYIRRVPKPGGGYRYYYRATGATRAVGADLVPGAKFKLTHEGQAGHFEVVRRAGNQVVLRHDESGGTMTVDAGDLGDLLKREHADIVGAAQARAKRDLEAARKHGSPKQIARMEARAKRLGVEDKEIKMRADEDAAEAAADHASMLDAVRDARKDTQITDHPSGGLRGVLSDGWAYSDLISVSPETTYDQMVDRMARFIKRAHWPQSGASAVKKFLHAWHIKTRGTIPRGGAMLGWAVQDALRAAIKAAGHDPDEVAPAARD